MTGPESPSRFAALRAKPKPREPGRLLCGCCPEYFDFCEQHDAEIAALADFGIDGLEQFLRDNDEWRTHE